MAKKISELPAVTSVGANDDLIVNPQGGNSSKVSATNLADSINLTDASASGESLIESQSGLTKQLRTVAAGAGMAITESSGVLTFTAAGGITNRVVVEDKSDLPAASGGVITLSGGTEYLFAGTVALGTDRLDASAGSIALVGTSAVTATITYTGTSPMITKANNALVVQDIAISAGSAEVFDDNSAGTGTLYLVRALFANIDGLGTIDQSLTFSMIQCGFLGTITTPVVEFTGAGTTCRIEQNDFRTFTGTAIDLGTATFDYISVTGNAFLGASGNTALSGAASGANVNANGRLLVENNYIDPVMTTAINTITADDDKVTFFGNNSVRNSEVYGNMYISTAGTTTISGASTPVKVGDGATVVWTDSDSGRITFANSGRYTYSDSIDEKVRVICSNIVLDNKGAGTNVYRLYIAKNGSVIANDYAEVSVTAGTVSAPISVATLATLTDTDYLELWVSNETDTDDVEVSRATFMVN